MILPTNTRCNQTIRQIFATKTDPPDKIQLHLQTADGVASAANMKVVQVWIHRYIISIIVTI